MGLNTFRKFRIVRFKGMEHLKGDRTRGGKGRGVRDEGGERGARNKTPGSFL